MKTKIKIKVIFFIVMVIFFITGSGAGYIYLHMGQTSKHITTDINSHFASLANYENLHNQNPLHFENKNIFKKNGKKIKYSTKKHKKTYPTKTVIDGIIKLSFSTYLIDKEIIDDVKHNYSKYIVGINSTIVERYNRPIGFKLYGISRHSYIHVIGLRNRDIIIAINGFKLNSITNVTAAMTNAIQSIQFRLDIIRSGKPMSFYYRFNP